MSTMDDPEVFRLSQEVIDVIAEYGDEPPLINLDHGFFQRCPRNPFYSLNQPNKDKWFRRRHYRLRTLINRLLLQSAMVLRGN